MATLKGTNRNDSLVTRGIFADTIYGYDGDDTLDGGLGSNKLIGGVGNDTYILNSASDVITELAGEGIDTARASFSIDLRKTAYANVENVVLTGTALRADGSTEGNALVGNAKGNALYGYGGNDTLDGRDGNDTLDGGDDSDTLLGGVGQDVLLGGGGADLLDGGTGNDKLAGGAGDDRYLLDNAADVVTEAAEGGNDTVVLGFDVSDANLASYANVENLTLSGLNGAFLTGTGNANVLTGNAGGDGISGNGGDDTLIGLGGGDTYYEVNEGDVVMEAADGGVDTIEWAGANSVDLANFANIENVRLLDAAVGRALDVIGSSANNVLVGNAYANALYGGGGNDTLNGGGVMGNIQVGDTLVGGAGDDTYVLAFGINYTWPVVIEKPGDGIDTINASFNGAGGYRLLDDFENLSAIAYLGASTTSSLQLYGNDLDNTIAASAYQNHIDGGKGADKMSVYVSHDAHGQVATFVVDDAGDSVSIGGSNYSIYAEVRSSIDYDLSQQSRVAVLTLTGQADLKGSGSQNADTLTGNGGANVMSAGAGDDVINGGLGNDSLDGGQGDDTFLVAALAGMDTVSDAGGTDILTFTGDTAYDHLFFSRLGNDLSIQIISQSSNGFDAASGVKVAGWFNADTQHIETIKAGGRQLDHTQVQGLLDAMAQVVPAGQALEASGSTFVGDAVVRTVGAQTGAFWAMPA
jgi:Ca2+-binding RTX toxin-like protein